MEDDIAVIGIGCNFPGGETLDTFWRVLLEGKNCAVDIPAERFDTSLWYDADSRKAGKTQTTKAALIEGFNELDHKFFGITEAEADLMDPQQKLLLHCTYRALEDAGLAMERVSGSRTGVYIGLMNRDYEMLRSISPTTITHYSATGTAMSVAANRVSFTFNLTGPSFALDSACSSSLVAVHLACQAIKQGDCEMALCGGVSCIIEPRVFVALSKAKMMSPEGTSKPFSSRADGYGRGEGCGVVLLKPLKKATRDHNKIWGIISKTAVNQDGRSVSPITKPSMVQQEELLRRIYSQSDLANVQYVEAHGTGTPAGDPTEAGSIANVIAKARPAGSETLRIGSVKSNIGHTESAAGVAGLIKVLLMMKHETIVPSVFYSEDSASVDVKALKISIPTEAERWETNGLDERVAGVNSFGFGGTNAHVIVREHRTTAVEQIPKGCPKIFVVSAASEKSFTLTITDTLQRLRSNQPVDVQALAYTSACGRTHSRHKHRKAFLTSSLSDLQHQLSACLETEVESFRPDMQVVFVFCGNGVAYRGMCQQLLRDVPVFRDTVTEVEKVFQRHKSTGLSKWLSGECDDLSKPDVVQPLLFGVQVGLANVLKTWGIQPDAVLGHSVGEVAAAHCSGLLSLEDAVKVLHHRSSLQSKVTGGKMLVVSNVAVEKILEMLQAFSGKICVAAFNSPQSCTLSGDGDAIDVLQERLRGLPTDKKLFLHVLDVPAAYHSHLMDPILDDIERSIGLLDANTMECRLLSTVTGGWYSEGDFCSGTYWAKNIREPVVFEQTLRAATEVKQAPRNVVFVEIGPRRALQGNIRETLGNDALVLPSAQPGRDYDALLSAAGRLFELGIDVDWHQLYRGYETRPAAFPVYQFETLKKSLNFGDVRRGDASFASPPHMLTSPKHPNNKESVYVCNLAVATAPYLWEHKNSGASILPGAFYVDLAYASVMTSLGPNKLMSLLQLSLKFESLFTLTSDRHQLKVTLEHHENVGSFKIQSDATTHASGTYVYSGCPPLLEEPNICTDTITQRCKLVMKKREIYSILSQAGFEYGSVFKQLHDVHFGEEFKEAVTTLQVLEELLERSHDYFIHPVLFDYFLQMTAVVAIGQLTTRQGFPSAIGSVSISGALQEKMILYLRATQDTPDFLEVCGCFSTTDGKVLVELKGVRISFMGNCSNVSGSLFFHNEIIAIKDERESNNFKIKALVFEDKLGIAKGLRQYLHPESVTVENRDCWMPEELHNLLCRCLDTKIDFTDVIFIWAVEDLSHLSSEQMLDCLVTSCELFRQTVTALRKSRRACTVRVITYRATETTVDHVSAGSVLSGMTRACAAEMPGLSFQLIDLASVTREDICTLAHILNTCKKQEVMISRGRASATRIARSPVGEPAPCRGGVPSVGLSNYALQTDDPYIISHLSAVACDTNRKAVEDKSVEIQLMSLCTHSSDFFPVTTSHLNFGRTMYWNKHASENHSLLALDYSGIVTAVGKDVGDVRVGDHVAACYPVSAAARVRIPEVVCYCTRRLPFLKEAPCVSFYMVAYEILQLMQPAVKQPRAKVVIVSSNPASAMIKVLALAANRSGWNVSTLQHFKGEQIHLDQGDAFVFLPPFGHSWQLIHNHRDTDRRIVCVRGDHMSAGTPALQSDHMHVHNVDVREVLQKARLRAQSRKVFKWMASLGFESASLPLKKEVFQLSSTEGPRADAGSESYFTAKTVQQVVLHHSESGCSVSGVPLVARPGQLFKRGCVYMVSGGLSGLGLETVRFIAHHGGGFIATLSRSAPTDETHLKMELLQKRYGVAIANVQCDVSVPQQVVDAVSEIEQRFSPRRIKGVFHSAAVLHDALIEGLDESAFRKVLRPKVSGALNLHYATLHSQLDFFVCYSSISSFIGNASQCNYAAANSFLDTFCHYRRNLGLAGQSINWGPLNLGLLLNKGHFQKFLEAKGMKIIDVCEVHEALRKCLLMNRAQQVICKFNFRNLNMHVLSQNASLRERLSPLVEMELKDDVSVEQSFQSSSSTHETVKSAVSQISGVGVDELDGESTLSSLGIDSMLAMTLQNNIFQETGVNVPLVRILDPHSTLSTVVTFVLNNG